MTNLLPLGHSRRNLVLLIAGAIFLFANNQMIGVTLPVYITRLGGTAADVGLLGGAASLGALLGRFLVGFAVQQQLGTRRLLVAGSFCLLPLMFLYLPLTTLAPIMFLRMVHAFFFAALMTIYLVAAAAQCAGSNQVVIFALAGLAMPVSLAIFPYLASAAIRHSFVPVIGLASTTAAAATLFFIGTAVGQIMEPPPAVPDQLRTVHYRGGRSNLFFGLLLLAATGIGLTDGVAIDLIPLFAQHLTIDGYGIYFTVYALCLIVAQLVIARVIGRTGVGHTTLAGFLLMAGAFVVLGVASNLTLLLLMALIQAAGFAASQTALSVLSLQGLPQPLHGRALSHVYFLFEVGRGGGLMVVGQIILHAGFTAAAFLIGLWCLGAAAAVVVALYSRRGSLSSQQWEGPY